MDNDSTTCVKCKKHLKGDTEEEKGRWFGKWNGVTLIGGICRTCRYDHWWEDV